MEDQILDLLRRHEARNVDQGLRISEITQQLGADQGEVLATLRSLEARGLVYEEGFWWYFGQRPPSA
jgi:DNA-binding IclR family transcriptional regulator